MVVGEVDGAVSFSDTDYSDVVAVVVLDLVVCEANNLPGSCRKLAAGNA